jgi:hypothetical protein
MEIQIDFGFPEEWQEFESRNKRFFARLANLEKAFEVALRRNVITPLLVDRVIFLFGRLCVEDFREILLLAANGYGFGAFKILRGLYERAVTAAYLSDHPEEVDAFLNFHRVSQYKLANSLRKSYGDDILSAEAIGEIVTGYRRVKDQFLVTDCKKCGTKRPNHTWSKLDFVSMACKSGALSRLIVPAYYIPLGHAHATVQSFLSRLEETPSSEGVEFNPSSQPDQADMALLVAHQVMLGVLETQDKHFKPEGLTDAVHLSLQDFEYIWPEGRPDIASTVD